MGKFRNRNSYYDGPDQPENKENDEDRNAGVKEEEGLEVNDEHQDRQQKDPGNHVENKYVEYIFVR